MNSRFRKTFPAAHSAASATAEAEPRPALRPSFGRKARTALRIGSVVLAIRRSAKRNPSGNAVRAISRIHSAIETSLRRLKRKSFGIVVFLYRRLRSHPILNQASHTNETLVLCASLRSVGISLSSFAANKVGSFSFGNKVYSARLTTRLGEL